MHLIVFYRNSNGIHVLSFILHCFLSDSDGKPDGICLDNSQCIDKNSSCKNELCKCNTGYSDIAGICKKGEYQSP